MSRYKDFSDGSVLPASDLNGLQDWVSAGFSPITAVLPLGGRAVDGAKYVRAAASALPVSAQTVYTVPAGKKAIVGPPTAFNSGAADSVLNDYLVPAGQTAGNAYRRVNRNITTNGVTSTSLQMAGACMLAAGGILAASGSTAGVNAAWPVIELPDTAPYVGAFASLIPTTDTVLYTCPAGKTATLLAAGEFWRPVSVGNVSAGTVSLSVKIKPAGGSAIKVYAEGIGSGALANYFPPLTLGAGDALVVSASQANYLNVWAVFVEL